MSDYGKALGEYCKALKVKHHFQHKFLPVILNFSDGQPETHEVVEHDNHPAVKLNFDNGLILIVSKEDLFFYALHYADDDQDDLYEEELYLVLPEEPKLFSYTQVIKLIDDFVKEEVPLIEEGKTDHHESEEFQSFLAMMDLLERSAWQVGIELPTLEEYMEEFLQ